MSSADPIRRSSHGAARSGSAGRFRRFRNLQLVPRGVGLRPDNLETCNKTLIREISLLRGERPQVHNYKKRKFGGDKAKGALFRLRPWGCVFYLAISSMVKREDRSLQAQFYQYGEDSGTTVSGRRIGFGIKDSKESLAAFTWACANLVEPNDTIYLIHAYEINALSNPGLCEVSNIIFDYQRRCHIKQFKCHCIQIIGNPAQKVAEATRLHQCDLLILGARRQSDLLRAILGCKASDIAQTCPCPVMIVKMPKVRSSLARL